MRRPAGRAGRLLDRFATIVSPPHRRYRSLPHTRARSTARRRPPRPVPNELRDRLFVRVTLRTVLAYAHKTFIHLRQLDAAFHAGRQIGALPPEIDRGTAGIAFLLGVGLLTIVPPLVFDEATSALDSDSEHAIQQELDRLSRNRTTLVTAHRLSSIVAADEILVLDGGRIVERGSHAGLLRRDDLYARLWRMQQRRLQEDDA